MRQLPQKSRTMLALGGESFRWDDSEHLLATVVDVLAQGNWMYATVHRGKGPAPSAPRPLKRPGVREHVEGTRIGGRAVSVAEFEVLYARMRPKGV